MVPLLFIRTQVFGLTQAEMAAVAEVSQSTVSKWENGLLEPDRKAMEAIRSEAARLQIDWSDSWFFAPKAATPTIPEHAEVSQ